MMSDISRWLALAGDPQMKPTSRAMFRDMALAALEKAAPTPQPGQSGYFAHINSKPANKESAR